MHTNSGVNKVFLVGHIETLPECCSGAANNLSFTMATKEVLRKAGLPVEHIEHHHIIMNADDTEMQALELNIGDMLHITGKATTRTWTDTMMVKRYKTEILASQITLLHLCAAPDGQRG